MVWNIFIFPYIGFLIIPIDFHIFQRGGPTTNQITTVHNSSTMILLSRSTSSTEAHRSWHHLPPMEVTCHHFKPRGFGAGHVAWIACPAAGRCLLMSSNGFYLWPFDFLDHEGRTITHHPFGNVFFTCLYNLFRAIWGMVYYWFTH